MNRLLNYPMVKLKNIDRVCINEKPAAACYWIIQLTGLDMLQEKNSMSY